MMTLIMGFLDRNLKNGGSWLQNHWWCPYDPSGQGTDRLKNQTGKGNRARDNSMSYCIITRLALKTNFRNLFVIVMYACPD